MWCSSCHNFIISSSVPFAAVTSIFISKRWTFLSVTSFPITIGSNLSVTERKVYLLEMKIDVTAAKGTEEEMMKSWQEEHHMQVVLLMLYNELQYEIATYFLSSRFMQDRNNLTSISFIHPTLLCYKIYFGVPSS